MKYERLGVSTLHRINILFLLCLFISACASSGTANHTSGTPQPTNNASVAPNGLALHVVGNKFVNAQGQAIRLIGVDVIAGDCVTHPNNPNASLSNINDGPSDIAAAAAMANWHINIVRITPNEDCWLGLNGVNPSYSGTTYQNTIIHFVNLLHSHGIYAIIDLHNAAPGTILDTGEQPQFPMADMDHAPAYWTSVANTFKNDQAVIFEPYNEPNITTTNAQTTNPWACWRDGCTITTISPNWQSAGMQMLINTIRATGASNPISVGGLNYSQDLSQFLQYPLSDPKNQLVAEYHNYMSPTSRNTLSYWNSVIAPIAQKMPVLTDEFGEKDCQSTYIDPYMQWADSQNISYLAWVWAAPPFTCSGDGILANWNGTPNSYGQFLYNHFQALSFTI